MPAPKKERWFDGVRLSDNLYLDAHKREGYWRYRMPDRRFKTFYAATVQKANEIADFNNTERERPVSDIKRHVREYIEYREEETPTLLDKRSWANRKGHLNAFAAHFSDTQAHRLTTDQIRAWWRTLTFHQQKARHAEFRRLFNYLMGEGIATTPYNPFALETGIPRMLVRGEPPKKRQRMTRDEFWKIYAAAGELKYEGLQIAMGLSLTTFMREGDICSLKLSENLENDLLKLTVSKSLNQRGSSQAARLQWDVGSHQLVKSLLLRSRELSMRNFRCPYVISHMPKIKKLGKTKDHYCQVTPRVLIAQFAEARDASGITLGASKTPATFHEIRSLASKLAKDAGYQMGDIQNVMAHERDTTTKSYMEGHQLPFDSVDVVFTEDMVGGKF